MIKPHEFGNILFAEPFRPFRIHMASGRTFEIRHPEFVKVGRSTFNVFTPPENDPDGPPREETLSLMLCEGLSQIEPANSEQGDSSH